MRELNQAELEEVAGGFSFSAEGNILATAMFGVTGNIFLADAVAEYGGGMGEFTWTNGGNNVNSFAQALAGAMIGSGSGAVGVGTALGAIGGFFSSGSVSYYG